MNDDPIRYTVDDLQELVGKILSMRPLKDEALLSEINSHLAKTDPKLSIRLPKAVTAAREVGAVPVRDKWELNPDLVPAWLRRWGKGRYERGRFLPEKRADKTPDFETIDHENELSGTPVNTGVCLPENGHFLAGGYPSTYSENSGFCLPEKGPFCEVCKGTIALARSNQKYCGVSCRKQAENQRQYAQTKVAI